MQDGIVQMQRRVAGVVLLSELFPPAIGGTPVLFDAIYSRLNVPVAVLTHAIPGEPRQSRRGGLLIERRAMAERRWGVLDRVGLTQHLKVAASTWRLARQRRPSVVHCGRALPEGVAAWMARRAGGSPYVCWSHGEDLAAARQSREFTHLTRRVCEGAAMNIANSRNTAAMLEAFGIQPRLIRVVHPGVDADRFRPDVDGASLRVAAGVSGDGPLLLSVGRLQRRKGHDLAIAAVASLVRELPGLRYVIVGEGEERARLEAQAAALDLAGRVTFAGSVDEAVLPQWYAACDMFLLPNRIDDADVEGFGIVFLEAAASGRPAIGGNTGGVSEALDAPAAGYLVSGTDVDELAAAIRRLAGSPSLRLEMGRAARARVCRDFTWTRAAAQVADIHAEIAGVHAR
jgi:phosphatidyl-myo-inositol dimannoside synthase